MASQRTIYHWLALPPLLLNGIGATAGGIQLMRDPTGGIMNMPLTFLEGTPFSDYFIPGLILMIFLGLGSIFTMAIFVLRPQKFKLYLALEGAALSIWICVQVMMVGGWYNLQVFFLFVGLLMLLLSVLILFKKPVQA